MSGTTEAVQAFTAPMQPFFWYQDRPTAFQGTPGTDTTRNLPWQFIGTFDPPTDDTAHTFTFALMVSAAWPSPNDTAWSTLQRQDRLAARPVREAALEDAIHADQRLHDAGHRDVQHGHRPGAHRRNRHQLHLYRAQRLHGHSRRALHSDARNRSGHIAGAPLQALFGLVEPGAAGKQAVVGIYRGPRRVRAPGSGHRRCGATLSGTTLRWMRPHPHLPDPEIRIAELSFSALTTAR